ncbi:ribokinase [Lysinibacillus sp. SGAir0095]|uniref:ribokinase n=1 Tax=Lysinibacillus sp. SGAir0095 TaxID=2070463 RepID=UPI0010CD02C3|nr:ribokinase [Lysinibacillus sp. SGAir0095]QCR33232.1 ribokinase [Lysinibacillus sp. SGAir0095]
MITVIGSINMDLIVGTDVFPKKGETLLGSYFEMNPGGKGANQAVAIARLDGEVSMVGRVGIDSFGEVLFTKLEKENVNVNCLKRANTSTGIANIILHERDNRILVVPGANSKVTPKVIDEHWEHINKSSIVVMQLEIPIETVEYTLNKCKENRIQVILNPAPASFFKPEWIELVDYLTPNEHEFETIFGEKVDRMIEKYPNKVIVTLGDRGVCYHNGKKLVLVSGYKGEVTDTTGAGDTFNGAFAYAISKGFSLEEALQFANIAASISIEKIGAQSGMPTLAQVEKRLSIIK